jgi:hypothetical protein
LERALSSNQPEDITKLYLGLTLVREGDRQRASKEIESGMRGINNFLDYINQAQRYSIGQFWDPARDIRSAIQSNLAMISGKEIDWQKLTADTEWLGIRMEQESDKHLYCDQMDVPIVFSDNSHWRFSCYPFNINHWFACQGCFSNTAFYLLDGRRVLLLKDLVSDDPRKHVARDVPSRSGRGQYGKYEKYTECD